jgi:ABC-type transport system involved in multi-copper enzyme maturation permease subunit
VIAIARLSLLESARRRVVWVLVLVTLLVVLVTAWGFDQVVAGAEPFLSPEMLQAGVARLLVFVMFMYSFVLAMVAASLAAPAVSSEIETGQVLAVLARPLARWRYLTGRWLGLAVVLMVYAFASGALELLAVAAVTGYVPPSPLGAMGFLAAQGLAVFSLGILLSTRLPAIASGAIPVVLFGVGWVIGILGSLGSVLGTDALQDVAAAMRYVLPTDALWRAAADAAEPAGSHLGGGAALADPFAGGGPPDPGYLAFVTVWFAAVIALAAWSLSRREL